MTNLHPYGVMQFMNPAEQTAPILRKPTGTIHLQNPFGLGELRLLNVLMYHVQTLGLQLGEEQEIPLSAVRRAFGRERSKERDTYKSYLRALVGNVIEWNQFGEDKRSRWVACTFLSHGELHDSTIRFMVNPRIVKELQNPVLYAKVKLIVQSRLSRRHSLVLYEFFMDALGRKLLLNHVPLEQVCDLLGLTGETHRQYKYLHRDVLKPALAEINRSTDLQVKCKPVTEGRWTVALLFVIQVNTEFQFALDLDGRDEVPPSAVDVNVEQLLAGYGVSSSAAATLAKRYGEVRIRSKVSLLEDAIEKGQRPANTGAWLRRAIEKDWTGTFPAAMSDDSATRAKPAGALASRARAARQIEDKEWEDEFSLFRLRQAGVRFAERTLTFRTRRRNAFRKAMEAEGNTTVLDALRRGGWEHPMVRGCFFSHGTLMRDLLVEPHERSLDAFRKWPQASMARTASAAANTEAADVSTAVSRVTVAAIT